MTQMTPGSMQVFQCLLLIGGGLVGTVGIVMVMAAVMMLTSITSEIGPLKAHENQLTVIPPEVGQLTSLKELNLHQDQLTSIPPKIGQAVTARTY